MTTPTKHYDNVMIDLETLGTKPGSVIVSIGAVAFNLGEPQDEYPTFYEVFSLSDTVRYNFSLDLDTMIWWMKQTNEARKVFHVPGRVIADVLTEFNRFVATASGHRGDVKVWGNGADFDNVLLAGYYRELGIPAPWKYHNNRCFRTVRRVLALPDVAREGTHHNALDDALYQVKVLQQVKNPSY